MKVLLLEPDRLLASSYSRALEHAGHKVTICATAQAAIYCADDVMPDVVITELQLVGHSGIEFLYEFCSYSDWQQVPIIVLTHVPVGEFANSWQLLKDQLNVRAYLYKPLTSLQTLLKTLNDFATVEA